MLLQTLCKSDDAPPTVILRLVVHLILIFFMDTDGAFDEIAKKRHVFKVETIGDSYVACAGVPEADAAHAVKMARFAYDCVSLITPRQPSYFIWLSISSSFSSCMQMIKMSEITKDLETQLGPDTGA